LFLLLGIHFSIFSIQFLLILLNTHHNPLSLKFFPMASSSAVGTLAIGALGAPPTIAVAPRQKTLQKNAIGNRTNVV
jgi:hypothetical protein